MPSAKHNEHDWSSGQLCRFVSFSLAYTFSALYHPLSQTPAIIDLYFFSLKISKKRGKPSLDFGRSLCSSLWARAPFSLSGLRSSLGSTTHFMYTSIPCIFSCTLFSYAPVQLQRFAPIFLVCLQDTYEGHSLKAGKGKKKNNRYRYLKHKPELSSREKLTSVNLRRLHL